MKFPKVLVLLAGFAAACGTASMPSPSGGNGGEAGSADEDGRSGSAGRGGSAGTMGGASGGASAGASGGPAGMAGQGGVAGAGGAAGTGGVVVVVDAGTDAVVKPAEIAEGAGVFFSGRSQTPSKLVAADTKPGYMYLQNSFADVPLDVVAVDDPALPAGTKWAVHGTVAKPGAINLIFGINFRPDGASGWTPFDVSPFAAFEFTTRVSLTRLYYVNAYFGQVSRKTNYVTAPANVWQRKRFTFAKDLFGPVTPDLTKLGRIDVIMSIETNNPRIDWWMTGIRFLTQPQLDAGQ